MMTGYHEYPGGQAAPAAVSAGGSVGGGNTVDYRVSYEHSLASAPDDFIVQVPGQTISDVPASVPRALLPEFITDLIRER